MSCSVQTWLVQMGNDYAIPIPISYKLVGKSYTTGGYKYELKVGEGCSGKFHLPKTTL